MENIPGHWEQTGWPFFRNGGKLPKTILALYNEQMIKDKFIQRSLYFWNSCLCSNSKLISVYLSI